MKFYSWNVNGIRAVVKKGTFQKFVAEHKPDILCLQETKAEKGQAEIDLPDYCEYWNSAEKKGYSGTAIFSRTEPLKVINGFPDGFAKKFTFADELKRDSWNEGRVITAEFPKYYAVTVYTPNAKDDLSRRQTVTYDPIDRSADQLIRPFRAEPRTQRHDAILHARLLAAPERVE